MWTAHNGPSLFWPSKVYIFQFNSVLIFTIFVRWLHGYTHIRLMLRMMLPLLFFFLFLFYSSFTDCYCSSLIFATAFWLRAEWRVVFSFSSALTSAKRFFSFSSALTSAKSFLCSKRYLKIEIGSRKIRTLNPHHFLPLKKLRRCRGLNPGLQLPIMSLMHLLLKSIDADMKIRY